MAKGKQIEITERTMEDWQQYVGTALLHASDSIIDVGIRMNEFRTQCKEVEHKQAFFDKARELWGLSSTAASMWSQIGQNKTRLLEHKEKLPASMRSMYEVITLKGDDFDDVIEELRPDMTQNEIRKIKKRLKDAKKPKPGPIYNDDDKDDDDDADDSGKTKPKTKRNIAAENREMELKQQLADKEKEHEDDPLPSQPIDDFANVSMDDITDALALLGIDTYNPRNETWQIMVIHYRKIMKGEPAILKKIDEAYKILKGLSDKVNP